MEKDIPRRANSQFKGRGRKDPASLATCAGSKRGEGSERSSSDRTFTGKTRIHQKSQCAAAQGKPWPPRHFLSCHLGGVGLPPSPSQPHFPPLQSRGAPVDTGGRRCLTNKSVSHFRFSPPTPGFLSFSGHPRIAGACS